MQYIAQQVTEFVYTNIPATWSDFNPATTYVLETDQDNLTDASVVLYENYYYRSLTNENVGNIPTETLNIHWVKWQVSNRYAMIDLSSQSKSIVEGDDLIVEFTRNNIESIGIGNFQASAIIIEQYNSGNGVVTGLTTPVSVDLSSVVEKGLVFVDSIRIDFDETAKTFTALKDTYVDINSSGVLVYSEVANGAGAPALTAPNERLSKVVTDADNITSVEDLRTMLTVATQTIEYSVNEEVTDYWSYIYAEYSLEVERGILINIPSIGEVVRVTFVKQIDASCGFMIAGVPQDMGVTLATVDFNFNSFATKDIDSFGTLSVVKRNVQDLVDFETKINNNQTMSMKREVKKIYNDIVLFVVDPSDDSIHENLLTLGVIENAHIVLTVMNKSTISWSIFESL